VTWSETWVAPKRGDHHHHHHHHHHHSPTDWKNNAKDLEEKLRPLNDFWIRHCLTARNLTSGSETSPFRANRRLSLDRGLERISELPVLRWFWKDEKDEPEVGFHGVRGDDEKNAIIHHLPTTCLRFLSILRATRPNHSLLLADFDYLPGVSIPGLCAPLVSEPLSLPDAKKEGKTHRDHATYLVPAGLADIFYPTDFEALRNLYAYATAHGPELLNHEDQTELTSQNNIACASSSSEQQTNKHFMYKWADYSQCQLRDGTSPLLEEFENTRIFTGRTWLS